MEIKNNVLVKVTDADIENGTFIIPEYITEIGEKAFQSCQSLIKINIPDNIYIIGPYAFACCNNLRKVVISDNVTKIGTGAFYMCESLSKINIPNNITCIESFTFENCHRLTNIELPDSIIAIGESAFEGCQNLKEITIPKGVTTISESLFRNCSSLVTINLLGNIEKIKNGAFEGCQNLKKLVVPPSIKYIGNFVFDKCKKCNLILPRSLIDGVRVTDLDVYSLKINGKRILFSDNMHIYHFGFNIKTIIKEELLTKIEELLKSKNINDRKYFKYKEHKELIEKILNLIVRNSRIMNIEKYLNDYINGYLEDKELKIESDKDIQLKYDDEIRIEKNLEYTNEATLQENQKSDETRFEVLSNSNMSNEIIVESNPIISKDLSIKNIQQEGNINERLRKLSELPEKEIALIMDMVKNNILDENIERYINMSNEERLKILKLESDSQQPYKVILEKEPIEEYKARQKVKK